MLLQKYQENWVEHFNQLKKIIHQALLPLNISIEHIGSTSVPGLAAKPIIDIDIVFDTDISFDEINIKLEKLGYYHNGNQGIADRDVFKRNNKGPKHAVLDGIVHHLYVCPTHSVELQKHLVFRNYLIANSEATMHYQQLKYAIAEAANHDRKVYAQLKEIKATAFINGILKKANK